MKPNTSDHFNYRPWLAAAVSAAFFVPLLVLGGPALAKSAASASQYEYGGSSQYQYHGKVTICHHTHSRKHPWVQISVGAPAAKAHMRHHDTLGPCPTTSTSGGRRITGRAAITAMGRATTTIRARAPRRARAVITAVAVITARAVATTATVATTAGGDHGNGGGHGHGK